MIDVFEIQERWKPMPIALAGLGDFVSTPEGQADPSILLHSPNISPYCFDEANRQAIFVETTEGVDIAEYAFFYQGQFEHAQRLFVVPYETMHRVAVGIPAGSVPLVLIHSTGRSGSTLMSKAFGEIEETTSLSEPDVYTQIVGMRTARIETDDELTALLHSATKLLFKPAYAGASAMWVLKFRSMCVEIADLLLDAFPDARNLFLYRNVDSYIVSITRAFLSAPELEDTERLEGATAMMARYVPLLADHLAETGGEISTIEMPTLMWLSTMHRYVAWRRSGIPMLGVRYEDMRAHPLPTLREVFNYVGLPDDVVEVAARALDRDSQAGSIASREAISTRVHREITEEQWDQVRELTRKYPLPVEDVAGLPQSTASIER